MADKEARPIKYWKMTCDGIDTIGMFHQCGLPSMQVTATKFPVWDDQSKPLPLPTGVQPSFGDVTLARGVDDKAELWKWISKIAQEGCTPDTVKEVTIVACDAKSQPVQEWKLTDAYPTSYSAAGLAAAGTDVLTETITIACCDVQLGGQGGLTGGV